MDVLFSRLAIAILLSIANVAAFAGNAEPMVPPALAREATGLSIERPVVEVAGHLLGSGTIILLNREPVILTSSHVLQGDKIASVRLFDQKVIKLPVIKDWPIFDMAVIGLDAKGVDGRPLITHSQKQYLKSIAADGFCNQNDKADKADCLAKTYVNFRTLSELDFEHHVRLVFSENGVTRNVDSLTPQQNAWLLKDIFISGYYGSVFVAPIYLRPGSSGGALFCGKFFCGLITKVSASAEPMTLSITGDNIQAAIESPMPVGEWIATPKGRILKWKNGENTLTTGTVSDNFASAGGELSNGGGELSNGGGELGNGGGELSNGGGELSNGGGSRSKKVSNRYWQMKVKEGFYKSDGPHLYWIYGDRDVETLNPFLETHSSVTLNGAPIAFMDIQQNPPAPEHIFMSASLAIFNYYTNEKHAKAVNSYHSTPEAAKILAFTRKEYPAPVLKFARLYSVDTETHFTLLNNNCNTTAGDNAEALSAEYDRVGYNPTTVQDSPHACLDKWKDYRVDKTGFSVAHPFRVKLDPNLAVDVKFNDEANKEYEVRIDKHLQAISFVSAAGTLNLVPDLSRASSIVMYRDTLGKSPVTAVAIYDTDNINNLSRIFIKTQGRLLEFLTCVPGLNCSR